MSEQQVIIVEQVSKQFKVYFDKGANLKEKLLFRNRNHHEWRQVLKDISFTVNRGEAVALIGHNGCGKSTMLKLLTKIMYPNKGRITIKGRVSCLIELGAGFHPDMSGRENIYINASIFGLTHAEINRRLEQIIAFSELGDYIDNPVRTYSSGMYMRLAFSIAINVDADILLIDEILAVGDANFQQKCFQKLSELKAKGITIVLVTHDLTTVSTFCNRAIWINNGQIVKNDIAQPVTQLYLQYMSNKQFETETIEDDTPSSEQANDETIPEENPNRYGNRDTVIHAAYWVDLNGKKSKTLRSGKEASIVIEYKSKAISMTGLVFGIGIYTMDYQCIYAVNTALDGIRFDPITGEGKAMCTFENIPLNSNEYVLQVAIVDRNNAPLDFYNRYSTFRVVNNEPGVGMITQAHHWSIIEEKD